MTLHNTAFSTASLAKTMLGDLDISKPETVVATQTLELLLITILQLTMPNQAVQDAATRAVNQHVSRFSTEERIRGG
jgi:hypothetical protein